jgi:general secretion pathway protein H
MTWRSEVAVGTGGGTRGAAGFTLIEMVVVLAVMALLAATVMVRGIPVSPGTHARAAARAIAGALRTARGEAVMSNRGVSVTVDAVNDRYWIDGKPPQILPRDLRLALLTSRDEVVADGVGQIRFDPDGGGSGGRVAIAGGDRTFWVGIDWLTGRVSIVEKPH